MPVEHPVRLAAVSSDPNDGAPDKAHSIHNNTGFDRQGFSHNRRAAAVSGPQLNVKAAEKVEAHTASAVNKGAKVAASGQQLPPPPQQPEGAAPPRPTAPVLLGSQPVQSFVSGFVYCKVPDRPRSTSLSQATYG